MPTVRAAHVGSSPHTRGALAEIDPRQIGPRIIPAYAGSTPACGTCQWFRRDHPRIRGEHAECSGISGQATGSSPHTRGAPAGCRGRSCTGRIIPAYAGSTAPDVMFGALIRDHPRIRGEHKTGFPALWISDGSSPHTRGALEVFRMAARRHGIIPAYAGSTCSGRRRCPSCAWIIPAYAGSTSAYKIGTMKASGSSPHTRGAP